MINLSQDDDDRIRLLNEVDEICDRYEAAWKSGEQPNMEEFLSQQREELQIDLIPHLLEIDVAYRRKQASTVSLEGQETDIPNRRSPQQLHERPREETGELAVRLPYRFDRFELLEIVGRGATSAVFRALDGRSKEIVAIKMCHPFLFDDRLARLRFLREAETIAKLDCDGIVQIQDYGCDQDIPYLVMEFVEGESLSSIVKRGGLAKNHKLAAKIVAQAAKALGHAHDKGVIHRDIKPSNLLLAVPRFEPKSSQLEPIVKVVDFGLARMGESVTQVTRTGEVLGTPSYMSPEAIANGAHQADARSDIYGLGMVLYQLLTGRVPFTKSMPAILQQVLLELPTPPRQIDTSIPRDLELICLKCLDKNPASRFQTAEELEVEIRRWLAGEAIATRPDSPISVARRIATRHKSATISTAVVCTALLLITGMGFFFWNESRLAQRRTADDLLEQFMKCNSASFPSLLHQVQANENATSLVNAQLSASTFSPPDELRLRLALPQTQISDLIHLSRHIVLKAEAEEFSEVQSRFGQQALQFVSLIEPSDPEVDRIDFEFRQALLTPQTSAANDQEEKLCSAIAAGLLHLEIPERMAPWIGQIGNRKAAVSRNLVDVLKTQNHKNQLAACYALADMHRSEPKTLAPALEFAAGKPQQVLLDALRQHSKIAAEILERRLMAYLPGEPPRQAIPQAEEITEVRWRNASHLTTALLRLGSKRAGELLEKMPSSEPRLTTYFSVIAPESGVELSKIRNQLEKTKETLALRSIILAIGNYSSKEFATEPELRAWLMRQYLEHPSAAVHGAIRWVLRVFDEEDWLRAEDRGLSGAITPGKEWFVNSQGITMVILPSKGFPVPLAMSMEEITLAEFQTFRPEHQLRKECLGKSPLHPVTNVSVKDALSYCVWLSEAEGIDSTEQPVEFPADPDFVRVDLTRPGYRLPTLLELHLASQAGAGTWRYCGDQETPFAERFIVGGMLRSSLPVGQRMPNAFGLFDTLGNVYDLTIDKWHSVDHDGLGEYEAGLTREVNLRMAVRTLGGAFESKLQSCQSVIGSMTAGNEGLSHIGFRIVCRAPRLHTTKRD